MAADDCLIWSFEHRAWWGPQRCGYTPDPGKAGIYTRIDANAIVADCYPGHEMAILVTEAHAWEQMWGDRTR